MTPRLREVLRAVSWTGGSLGESVLVGRTEWLLWQVRELYRELPGLALTSTELAETLNLEPSTADAMLMALADTRFLSKKDGRFILKFETPSSA